CTSRCSSSSRARTTWRTISCCPVRLWPPMEDTAVSNRSNACFCLSMNVVLLQLRSQRLADLDDHAGARFLVLAVQDLGFGLVQLGHEVPALIRDEHF